MHSEIISGAHHIRLIYQFEETSIPSVIFHDFFCDCCVCVSADSFEGQGEGSHGDGVRFRYMLILNNFVVQNKVEQDNSINFNVRQVTFSNLKRKRLV